MQESSVVVWGEGEPVILVHGSGDTDPTFVWSHQRPLAAHYQLLVVTRPGYGQRPISPRTHVEQDVQEILSLLEQLGGGHLVGFSYGGLIALLVAGRQPTLIRSLTVIEPPAFAIARGNARVEQVIAQVRPAYKPERPLAAEEFLVRFMKSIQPDFPDTIELSPEDRKGVEAMQTEPAPWKIEIPLSTLAATTFPKLVVTSGEHDAFEAVADILTQQLRAILSVCAGNGHYIPDTGEPFNQLLESFLQSAVTSTSLSYVEKGGK